MPMRTLLIVFVALAIAAFVALGIAIARSPGTAHPGAGTQRPGAVLPSASARLAATSPRKSNGHTCEATNAKSAPRHGTNPTTKALRKFAPVACEQPPRSQFNLSGGLNDAAKNALVLAG